MTWTLTLCLVTHPTYTCNTLFQLHERFFTFCFATGNAILRVSWNCQSIDSEAIRRTIPTAIAHGASDLQIRFKSIILPDRIIFVKNFNFTKSYTLRSENRTTNWWPTIFVISISAIIMDVLMNKVWANIPVYYRTWCWCIALIVRQKCIRVDRLNHWTIHRRTRCTNSRRKRKLVTSVRWAEPMSEIFVEQVMPMIYSIYLSETIY